MTLPRLSTLLFISLLLGIVLPAGMSGAQENEPDPDTIVLSDTLDYDDNERESVFTGNVIMTRGDMTLHADKLVLVEDEDGYQYGTATVSTRPLVHIRQENPEEFEVIEAQGKRGEYDGKTEELTVIGQAVVTRFICGKPTDTIRGERVVYKQQTNTYHAYSGPESAAPKGRVRSLVQPRSKSDAAMEDCRQAAKP
ncbi:MAG TPA: lipopolysaccharide transport periplasmic protein LptA [Burkholderiaceae bacterium]|nr:lipopolysaccharide transport periplasmic protein LptA [Burkholderiaceae bacterium]